MEKKLTEQVIGRSWDCFSLYNLLTSYWQFIDTRVSQLYSYTCYTVFYNTTETCRRNHVVLVLEKYYTRVHSTNCHSSRFPEQFCCKLVPWYPVSRFRSQQRSNPGTPLRTRVHHVMAFSHQLPRVCFRSDRLLLGKHCDTCREDTPQLLRTDPWF